MRIAFVGKGGSGKTTLAALFTNYLVKKGNPVLAIDADINMHMGELLGFNEQIPFKKQLSSPEATKFIKQYLKGKNNRIKELSQFRKTTPPTRDSNFIRISENDPIINNFSLRKQNLAFMVVGTYDLDGIGASCYHNNLAILENLLSHILDKDCYVVVDMVAGTDAFANTLHFQFDLLVLVIEPTRKGLEVFRQYYELAKSAGIDTQILVIGNKIRSQEDKTFLLENIPNKLILDFFSDSNYLRKYEQKGDKFDLESLEESNLIVLDSLFSFFSKIKPDREMRLKKLYEIHKKYVAQDSIKERFGDLSDQIDESFEYSQVDK
ncbi:MAG: AAA family ATPase [Candidatus Marsarchaeota archaeon]|nr:AAA family ATPase [Candidatus Marsarchaeota archaeon]